MLVDPQALGKNLKRQHIYFTSKSFFFFFPFVTEKDVKMSKRTILTSKQRQNTKQKMKIFIKSNKMAELSAREKKVTIRFPDMPECQMVTVVKFKH